MKHHTDLLSESSLLKLYLRLNSIALILSREDQAKQRVKSVLDH